MPTPVVAYDYLWNLRRNVGQVRMRFASGQGTAIPVASLADLAGWAALLQSGRAIGTEDGSIVVQSSGNGAQALDGTEVPFP